MGDVISWFSDPSHWQGTGGIPNRVLEHLILTIPPLALAAALAVPLGVYLGHARRGALFTISVANIGRALPSFAVLVLAIPFSIRLGLGLSYWPAFVAMLLLAVPPMLTNAFTGIKDVDPEVVEAAYGMGLTGRRVLTGTEIPMALPVIITGVRVSAVQVVATATLAALIAGGGLGRYIIDGLATGDMPEVVAGAVLVAALAVITEVTFSGIERITVSPGVRRASRFDALAEGGSAS